MKIALLTFRYGHQIDPFGHSNAIPLIHSQIGFQAVILNRMHFSEKQERKNNKEMEFVWQSPVNSM
jgi:hypothetical protein